MNDRERRIKRKEELIRIFGNKCSRCGYNKSSWALVFHHTDEKSKHFNISGVRLMKSLEKLISEANKCRLLCANCHAEIHEELCEIQPKQTAEFNRAL